jgi:hypothetical protein
VFGFRQRPNTGVSYRIPAPLAAFGRKGSSQTNESGFVDALVNAIPVRRRFFVEFGIGPGPDDASYERGLEGNCVDLAGRGWQGLFLDGSDHPEQLGVRKEFITYRNINRVLAKHQVPEDFAIISIDVDGQEYWIWRALKYRPEIAIVEYNTELPADASVTVPCDPGFRWDGTNYHGASLRALYELGLGKGYTLVHGNRVNAFFVRSDLVANREDFVFDRIYERAKIHRDDPHHRRWQRV